MSPDIPDTVSSMPGFGSRACSEPGSTPKAATSCTGQAAWWELGATGSSAATSVGASPAGDAAGASCNSSTAAAAASLAAGDEGNSCEAAAASVASAAGDPCASDGTSCNPSEAAAAALGGGDPCVSDDDSDGPSCNASEAAGDPSPCDSDGASCNPSETAAAALGGVPVPGNPGGSTTTAVTTAAAAKPASSSVSVATANTWLLGPSTTVSFLRSLDSDKNTPGISWGWKSCCVARRTMQLQESAGGAEVGFVTKDGWQISVTGNCDSDCQKLTV